MELKELTEKTLEIFEVDDASKLRSALFEACNNETKLNAFSDLVDGDLSVDWMQMIYQYYLADRKGKKQDYTPSCLAMFMGMLAGECDDIVDLCAGSGALIIQKWTQNKDTEFTAIEYDENVIPFLLFNMVIRNIKATVIHKNALTDDEPIATYRIEKGEKYGNITNI